jgi:tetratricopeptide (TPR) repeat protein
MSVARALAAALVATAVAAATAASAPRARRLRGSEALARAYDAILDAQFDRTEAELDQACGRIRTASAGRGPVTAPGSDRGKRPAAREGAVPAPAEACVVLRATALWWRIQLDPHNLAFDPLFQDRVDLAIASAEAWRRREPAQAEAWFYLGGAYAARAQWRVLREERLAAARDGKRIKEALDRALTLDPELTDAYFGVGLYKYYADIAPSVAKFLRWFLMLPGGDKEEGLAEMLRARQAGELLQGEADYQLHIIYLWYEQRADLALDILEALQARYPGNPHFAAQIAELHDNYFHDLPASLAAYRALLTAASEQRVALPEMAAAQARLGIAKHLATLHESDLAIEHLRPVVEARPEAPFGAVAEAQMRLGEAYDRLGQRSQAFAAFKAALAALPEGDPHGIRARAESAMARRPNPRATDGYRLSLEGWRAFERGDTTTSAATLARALQLTPNEFVTRLRYGRVLAARHADNAALGEIERALAGRADAPPSLIAAAFLDAGAIHERAGRRDTAAVMYRHASQVFGGGADARDAAARALARVAPSVQ